MAAEFDFKHPDYVAVFQERAARLQRIREDPDCVPLLRAYYHDHIAQFITDWGCIFEPRNPEIGLPAVIPFVLFPRQVQWIEWVLESWRERRSGVTPKSRESGVTWLSVAVSASLCQFHEGLVIGFGSRKEEYVDKLDAPKAIFWKGRKFMEMLPQEFRGGFNLKTDAPYMRLIFRDTGSVMVGEAGDNIGRGDRASLYFVDEADFLEHPESVDASLSATTNCRIDISTANGLGKPFHRKVTEWPSERVFRFHWRDDPRKDEAWYAKQQEDLDPVILAREIDIDFAASVEGVLIPSAWVQAAIDAHEKLRFSPTGAKFGSLDVADEGRDLNAFCGAHGVVLEALEEWSGKGDDIFGTVQRAFGLCDEHGYGTLRYDADGLGAGVRGDARVINQGRKGKPPLQAEVFRGSAEVHSPESEDVKGRKNKDFFANLKAQSWWSLRMRFQKTFRAVTQDIKASPDEMISLPSKLPHLRKLTMELSQPTYSLNAAGKVLVDKAPEGSKSPNLADAVMIRFARVKAPMIIPDSVLAMSKRRSR